MADAGRILIIPRGDYNANSTYEKLDLVKHKGTSWLAKKDVVGIEPSKANAEYWYPMVDLAEYINKAEKPTVTYTGNGDATARTISIGGYGDVVCITNDTDLSMAIVTPSGYIAKTADGVVTCGTDTYTGSGAITVRTASAVFNTEGATYICRVI